MLIASKLNKIIIIHFSEDTTKIINIVVQALQSKQKEYEFLYLRE